MKRITLGILLSLIFNPIQAVLPGIGDSSMFTCVQFEDPSEPGMCFGDISWIANKFGEAKNGTTIRLKRAKKILNKSIKHFKKKRKQAQKQDDLSAFKSWNGEIANARQSKIDISTCFHTYTECEETSDDDSSDNEDSSDSPSLVQACTVITAPTTEGPQATSTFTFDKKFIVNGAACSNASTSPVIKILNQGSQHCTGVLILDDTVLTAAHCVENINCANILRVENADGSQSSNVSSCTAHSGYSQNNNTAQKNDLALLFLSSAFQGITNVKVNTLATTAVAGDLAAFAGYGIDENNNDVLKATFNNISNVKTEVISTLYTQGDTNQGTTCSGDSGGPLFIHKNGQWRTQGTLSDGSAFDCALPGTSPSTDKSNWANLTSKSNQNFIKNNTDGVLD